MIRLASTHEASAWQSLADHAEQIFLRVMQTPRTLASFGSLAFTVAPFKTCGGRPGL